MRKTLILIFCLLLAFTLAIGVSANEVEEATDISESTDISGKGYKSFQFLKDKRLNYYKSSGDTTLVLTNEEGMASLYLMFDYEYGQYTIKDTNNGRSITAGTYSFLHEFIDLQAAFGYLPTSVTLEFSNGAVQLGEIYVFSSGETPDFVQKWEPPLDGKADILMMPTHGDDDQLYFAGLLPYYAGELDCAVQVVYLTNHRCYTNLRIHEMINGLWATGVENYPLFAYRLDFRPKGDSIKDAYRTYASYGIYKDDLVGYVVEQFRRFKPQVVVGHDINGEYGHAMHKVYSEIIREAVEISNDPNAYSESAQKYGLWDVPKTYLHLLADNPIEINYDIPLESYDGLTAFQVTQKYGFPAHETQQQYRNFWTWLNGTKGEITKATEIELYNPCKFGLYRSTIGEDVAKNDFLENIVTYAEQERIEQERLEQERLEKERLERERLERIQQELAEIQQKRLDELERLEQERLEQERLEQERLEKERLEQEELERAIAEARKKNRITIACMAAVLLAAWNLASKLTKKHIEKQKNSKRLNSQK